MSPDFPSFSVLYIAEREVQPTLKAWEEFVNNPDPRDIQRKAQAEVPLEQVYSKWTVSEDPETHVQALRKLFSSGATHVFVHSAQPDQRRVIDFYGREVLPRFGNASISMPTSANVGASPA